MLSLLIYVVYANFIEHLHLAGFYSVLLLLFYIFVVDFAEGKILTNRIKRFIHNGNKNRQ